MLYCHLLHLQRCWCGFVVLWDRLFVELVFGIVGKSTKEIHRIFCLSFYTCANTISFPPNFRSTVSSAFAFHYLSVTQYFAVLLNFLWHSNNLVWTCMSLYKCIQSVEWLLCIMAHMKKNNKIQPNSCLVRVNASPSCQRKLPKESKEKESIQANDSNTVQGRQKLVNKFYKRIKRMGVWVLSFVSSFLCGAFVAFVLWWKHKNYSLNFSLSSAYPILK